MMEDSLQSQEFNCKFEPLKGNDSKRRFNSIFYEENDSCNSGFNMASMRSEVRMNALAFNLSTVTNATKMNLQKRIFTNQFKR